MTSNSPRPLRVRLSPRVSGWAGNSVLLGGSPWRLIRLAAPAQALVYRLMAAGPHGDLLTESVEIRIANELLNRGFLSPLPTGVSPDFEPDVVVPVLDAPQDLEVLLTSMVNAQVIVVDDGSVNPTEVARVAKAAGAQLVRQTKNLGPGAARNIGVLHTNTPVVAFIDADCIATSHWHIDLMFHFDDPKVAAVAPRVRPTPDHGSLLERFERTRSALDMGERAGLVQPGGRPSFVPSAALLVRRSAVGERVFDPDLRLGEDVDLIWRLIERGWLVRYDPHVVVRHKTRVIFRQWMRRRFEYGTSASNLEDRHPGKLVPLRCSPWNAATLLIVATGHPLIGASIALGATALLWRQLRNLPVAPVLAARIVAQGVLADGAAIGHLLRREWWPVGALVLAATPHSRFARYASVSMLGPVAWEWCTTRTHLDPISYTVLRLIEDAAYGSGVVSSSLRAGNWRTLLPQLSSWRRKRA